MPAFEDILKLVGERDRWRNCRVWSVGKQSLELGCLQGVLALLSHISLPYLCTFICEMETRKVCT